MHCADVLRHGCGYSLYMALEKLVCVWSGFTGAPGYSIFYATQGGGAQNTFNAFWTGIKPYLNAGTSIHIPNTGDVIDPANGKKTGVWGSGSASDVTGTVAGGFAPQAGAVVRWNTAAFINGKGVRGRTFLVPLAALSFSSTGLITTTVAAAIQAAAQSLITTNGNAMQVWHRPHYDLSVKPPVLVTPGSAVPMTTATVPTKAATLNSRRDI